MIRFGFSSALVLALLPACGPIHYDAKASPLDPGKASVDGFSLPDRVPERDPYTTYFEVKDGEKVVGYVVRYDAPPSTAGYPDRMETGAMWVEDPGFDRIGFVTVRGKGYRLNGTQPEQIGEGTIEQLVPPFFGKKGLSLRPMH